MAINATLGDRAFRTINGVVLGCVTVIAIAPLIHILAISLSSNDMVVAGEVTLWPRRFTLDAYRFLSREPRFFRALSVTLVRLGIGTVLNMFLCVITAYPLSKEKRQFTGRSIYVWFFAFTMFFSGGLIPLYIVVSQTGVMDTIWALVLPTALNVWFVVLMLNFFRGVPKELEEAALMDGATHFRTLFAIYLPISLPSVATILLFSAVYHWNSWFDGFIFINFPEDYPLQTYLASLVMQAGQGATRGQMSPEELERLRNIGDKNLEIAQIFFGMLPIMLVYPFLQRYFVKGIVIGSVKG
jgi:putative aldouronate transport system permease protein